MHAICPDVVLKLTEAPISSSHKRTILTHLATRHPTKSGHPPFIFLPPCCFLTRYSALSSPSNKRPSLLPVPHLLFLFFIQVLSKSLETALGRGTRFFLCKTMGRANYSYCRPVICEIQ